MPTLFVWLCHMPYKSLVSILCFSLYGCGKARLTGPLTPSPPLMCTAMPTLLVVSVPSILTVGLRLRRHHITFLYLSTATSTLPLLEYGNAYTVCMAPPTPYKALVSILLRLCSTCIAEALYGHDPSEYTTLIKPRILQCCIIFSLE
jgi:hypothetical protein